MIKIDMKYYIIFVLFALLSCSDPPAPEPCIPCKDKIQPDIGYKHGQINSRYYVGGVCGCKFPTRDTIIEIEECRYTCIEYGPEFDSAYIVNRDSILLSFFFDNFPDSCRAKNINIVFGTCN